MNKKDRRARSLEILAGQLIYDKDVEMISWYISRVTDLTHILNCRNCERPNVGILTCMECDHEDN